MIDQLLPWAIPLPDYVQPRMAVFVIDDFLIALAVSVVTTAIGAAITALTRPKPTAPTPATLADLDVPTAEDGRAVPRVFGTRWVKAPNVLWYGDLAVEPITDSVGK
jgi:hypothetical protein